MPLPVPPDLEDALAANPRARAAFDALPPERKDAWISWVSRGRGGRGRATRVAEAVRRLGGAQVAAADETVVEGREPAPPPPPREWWPWLLALLLLVVAGLLLLYFLAIRDNGKPKRTVPAVVGLQRNDAQARIRQRGLRSSVASVKTAKPVGTVVAQRPGGGSQLNKGETVQLDVSAGPSTVAVPPVTGTTTSTASQKLTAAGFVVKIVQVGSKEKAGTVTAQDPAAGTQASKGSTVRINVSKGPQKAAVPDVVGQQQAAAVKALQAAGFAVNVAKVPSTQPAGTVTAQQPAANAQAFQGSTVRINVSSGGGGTTSTATATTATTKTVTTATTRTTTTPAPAVRVPNVTGLAQRAATRRLNSAGLRAAVVYIASSQPAGRVIRQQPAPGTSLRRGSRVRISVSNGASPKALKTIPDVVGQDEATATSTLQAAGFVVDTFTVPVTDASQNGVVVDEEPAGGSQAPQGSLVTIYVGQTA